MADENGYDHFVVFDDDNNIRWTGTCLGKDTGNQGKLDGLHVTPTDQDAVIAIRIQSQMEEAKVQKVDITEDGIAFIQVDKVAAEVIAEVEVK